MTLEKDKEDQSKYYLSYPKPPVLDMKWENRDINVIEWENIPKFPLLLNGDYEKTFSAKTQCNFVSRWLEQQQGVLHSFF